MEEIRIKTRDWERLLTYEQKVKYASAIRQGYFADYHNNSWRHSTFYGAYIWKHPTRLPVIKYFTELIGHKPGWEDITDDNMRDLKEYLSDKYSAGSLKTIFAEIKALLRANNKSKNIPSLDYGSILKAKKSPTQNVYLSWKEIERIHRYEPPTTRLKVVKRLFMIECLTGARMSDCMNMSVGNLDDNGKTLTYVSIKTHTEVMVPVHVWLKKYLVPIYQDDAKHIQRWTYNKAIKDICEQCGICESTKLYQAGKTYTGPKFAFVTSHTGRRSFATNLARKGVSLEQIALMMGHMSGNTPNISMTQHYIVGKIKIDSKVFELFGYYKKRVDVPSDTLDYEDFIDDGSDFSE